jgi:hypothetical protein
MIEKHSRPYSAEEIKLLKRRKYSAWKHFEHFGMRWVYTTLIMLAPLLLYEKFVMDVPPQAELGILIILEIIAISLVLHWMKKSGELDWNKIIEDDIKNGYAEVLKIQTDRVVKRKDPEDFGSGFYLKIDENKTLFLQGQYFDELQYARKFPNTNFEIVRKNLDKELISIFSTGKYLKPERKIKAFKEAQYKTGSIHNDGDILELHIDDIS